MSRKLWLSPWKVSVVLLSLAALIFAISLNNGKVRYLLLQWAKAFQPAQVNQSVEPVITPENSGSERRDEPPVLIEQEVFSAKVELDMDHLSNGLDVKKAAYFVPPNEDSPLASEARSSNDFYQLKVELEYDLPRPAVSMDELTSSNELLVEIFPWLNDRLTEARVAPYFSDLYQAKIERVKKNQENWRKLLTLHHAYDTQTILEVPSEDQEQGMLLIQSEMDVVSDGTDGDRLPTLGSIQDTSHYQPFTSYGWLKTTDQANPLLSEYERLLLHSTGDKKKYYELAVKDMKRRSFLLGEYDPFIVLPVEYLRQSGDWAPSIGDYAIVVYEGLLLPAIVGDGGPSFKMGEASLRVAKQINEKATSYRRPTEHLEVTYLIFTKSATRPFRQPDYVLWEQECQKLIDKMGGLGEGYKLHSWEDLLENE